MTSHHGHPENAPAAAKDSATTPPPSASPASSAQQGEGAAAPDAANEGPLLDKVTRRKLKKLRKKVRSGQLSLHDTEECKKYGMVVRAEVDWSEEIKDGRRPCLGPGDLRRAIVHILSAGIHAQCPSWLRLANARLLTSVVVVSLAGVDPAYVQDNLSQLPFLQACTRPVALRLYHGPHPRRSIYSLLFYPRKKQGEGGGGKAGGKVGGRKGTSKDEEEDEEKGGGRGVNSNGERAVSSGRADNHEEDNDDDDAEEEEEEGLEEEEEEEEAEGVPDDDDVTVSVDPAERYVLSLPQLKLAGFPLPPGGVIIREPPSKNARGRTNSECHGQGHDDDDDEEMEIGPHGGNHEEEEEEDEDDVGCPVTADGQDVSAAAGEGAAAAAAAAAAPLSWLDCDEEKRWGGETGELLPSLEEARRILGGLNAIKVGGVTCCFYETLGSSSSSSSSSSAVMDGEGSEEMSSRPYRMAALDCEMCQTTEGMEVTRLTLVDERRQVLLDSFVKPHNLIVDHLTKYSGITPEIMSTCTTHLEQVQVALLRLIRAETILIGHSLEQDLMVVGLIHLRCVDTAILYPHPRGPQCRFALRVLVKKYLNRVIQDSVLGHCSQEDAEAALDLVQLKIEHGPEFGCEEGGEGGGGGRGEDVRGRESFLERLGGKHGKRCTLLDQSDTLVRVIRGSTASAVVCRSNEEVLSKAKGQVKQPLPPHFLWASLAAARPLTMESLEARKKRKVHQMQQQRLEAEATEAAAAAAAEAKEEEAATGGRRERGGGKRHKGEVISLISRSGSNSSLSSSSSSSSSSASLRMTTTTTVTTSTTSATSASSSSSSSSSSRMTTTVLRDTSGSPTALTFTATAAAATVARQHKRFLYQESIMEMVDPDLLRADQHLAELYESLPTNTLLLVLAQPDVALPTQLTSQRTAALHSRRATLPWTQEHEETLQELAKAAQKGVVMMRVR